MMKRKSTTSIILFIIAIQSFLIIPTEVMGVIDVPALTQKAGDINVALQTKLFLNKVYGTGIAGTADVNGQSLGADIYKYGKENSIAFAAFATRFTRSGNTETEGWAINDVYPAVSALGDTKIKRANDLQYYTVDQGAALEFLAAGYRFIPNTNVKTTMENMYRAMYNFKSSSTNSYTDAYWRAITSLNVKYEPDDSYKYCYTNASLWGAIGMLNFGLVIKGSTTDADENYANSTVVNAKKLLQFVETYCWFNASGFMEYPHADMVNPETKRYYFNTQVLGLLAYTRMYQASGEQVFLDKAFMMVKYIISKSFLDTGLIGGCYSYIDMGTGTRSNIKIGYDNALYAYALLNLYRASLEQDTETLKRAEEIIYFMNTNLYVVNVDGTHVGYIELMINNLIPTGYVERHYDTNSLMMLVNEEISYYEQPWIIRNLPWVILGSIGLVVLILVLVLVKRRKDVGRKLPKLVKGLIED